ncbi:hypothetical protein Tsp_05521 [Trichinella spiralis]|uniref:hypothetical protein n=1 Tax=Trichinella spiralis TaxID=6334 RepID=UPI0001EFDBA3|nr:hypothetical protein Tsp_05521 [Trichinella spiralis]
MLTSSLSPLNSSVSTIILSASSSLLLYVNKPDKQAAEFSIHFGKKLCQSVSQCSICELKRHCCPVHGGNPFIRKANLPSSIDFNNLFTIAIQASIVHSSISPLLCDCSIFVLSKK